MSAINLRLPESLHKAIRKAAAKENVSINQMITLAVGEKVSALLTEDYLNARGKKGSRKKFLKVLAKVPDVEPEPRDRVKR